MSVRSIVICWDASDEHGRALARRARYIAVATCAALSADHVLANRLGRDFGAALTAEAIENTAEERYTHVTTHFIPAMDDLDPDRRASLIARAERTIERLCTVGRTLEHGAETDIRVSGTATG